VKIDPYCQRLKCRPTILGYRNIRYIGRIFAGVPCGTASYDSGIIDDVLFSIYHFLTDDSLQSANKDQPESRAVAGKPHDAVVIRIRNLQRHRAVLPAIARLSCRPTLFYRLLKCSNFQGPTLFYARYSRPSNDGGGLKWCNRMAVFITERL